VAIVKQLDKAVDLVISGHTHQAYNCVIDDRLLTSAGKYGTVITDIDVRLDPDTRDVISAKANNVIVRTGAYAKDPAQTRLIHAYEQLAGPITHRTVGTLDANLSRQASAAGESPLGQVIADAQLAATAAPQDGGAVIAFTNPGGIRADMIKNDSGLATYADLYASQPFGNTLVSMTLTGAQIKAVLDQQWLGQVKPRILPVSKGFSYTWDAARPPGQRVLANSLKLNGKRLNASGRYRVTVNAFLASGGDGFATFAQGQERRIGPGEVAALELYFQQHSPVRPGVLDRIRRLH
jgi:5'-nucleotidase